MTIDETLSDGQTVERAEQYRRRKTTSVLAIVFTDIANSTALREQLGEVSYESFREDYDAQFSRLVESEEAGAVVKSTGDGALAVFSEPSTAVERCLRVQREHGEHPHFNLRVGIDMGQVSVKSAQGIVRDVFGRHVNRAARIQSLAEPGHVLTSFHVFDCAVGWLKGTPIRWHNHGVAELKGFEDLVSIHEAYDSSCGRPQSSMAIRPVGRPMFSRGAALRVRPVRLGTTEWQTLYNELRTQPLNIRPLLFTDSDDPYRECSQRLTISVERLAELVPETPSVLWVDSHPEDSTAELQVLRDAGCVLEISGSLEDAQERMTKKRYFLSVVAVGKNDDPGFILALMRWRKAHGLPIPTLVHGSPGTIALIHDHAGSDDSLLYAAGAISLLDGINQVFLGLLARIPQEEIETADGPWQPGGDGNRVTPDNAESGGWLRSLRRLLRR